MHNPQKIADAGLLDGIPIRHYYATDDTVVTPATVTAFVAAASAATAISMGTGGHSDTPLASIDMAELAEWVASYA